MQQQQWIETTTNNAGVDKGGYIMGAGWPNEMVGGSRPQVGQSNPNTWHRVDIQTNTVCVQSARMQGAERISWSIHSKHSNIDVKQHGLTDPFNLRDDTFEVERLCEHDFEYLLHVDRCGCRAKDERCVHCFGKSLCLLRDLLLFVTRECRKGIKLGADKEWYRGLHIVF